MRQLIILLLLPMSYIVHGQVSENDIWYKDYISEMSNDKVLLQKKYETPKSNLIKYRVKANEQDSLALVAL